MQTIFDIEAKNEILHRIEKLTPQSQRLWGKMNVAQMLAHCANGMEMATGKVNPPRELVGKIFGWMFKSSYYNNSKFPKNVQTVKGYSVTEEKDFLKEKKKLIEMIEEMHLGGEKIATTNPHPIMGSYTPAQWGVGMYKHLDHHLRQFGV